MKLSPVSLAALVVAGGLSSAALAQNRSTYIVQLAAEPKATYSGNVAGYAATKPAPGARFNARAPAALAYGAYLDAQQLSVASTVAGAPIVARYSTVINGFAAQLTPSEVLTLLANPQVVAIQPDEQRKLETVSTPSFLGLTAPGGLWSQTPNGVALKGEDIVIGVVDGGIWPESPSYADKVNGSTPSATGTLVYNPPVGWGGGCSAGEGFNPAVHCNNKLIGARFYNAGFLAFIAQGHEKHWTEFYSPRDSIGGATGHGGHGSHTSSTAGGNSNAPVLLAGLNLGTASGMAPRARIAAYKVCYTYVNAAATDGTGSTNSCFTSDSVAAIDQAVTDGVHVINYSISGSQSGVNDAVEQAFMRAASAGVFVAASAGNSGPAVAVAHLSPWLTTVAASTHSRALSADVTLGNGAKYTGASMNPTALGAAPIVVAEDQVLAGAVNPSLCFSSPPSLDPAKVTGKVVVCTRGTNARVDKSLAVQQAGGVGMVLVDNGAGLVAEAHSVPSVHVNATDGAAVKAYARGTAGGTAAISAFYFGTAPAPIMAAFSSRGPNQGDLNMLKPDLTAPGVDVIATVTPPLTQAQRDAVAAGTLVPGPDWASYQGTSMSSPHVAGIAALLKQAHPTWSPSAIKSALMTTATTTLDDGQPGQANGLLPWAQGAGHIVPNSATDPGLVYDNGPIEFIRYQCNVFKAGVIPASDCTTYGTLDQTYNYNLPSITVANVLGTVVTRKVTNVSSSSGNYTANVTVPPGFTAVVSPSSMAIAPGETKTFTVTLNRTTAAENVWSFGSLVWSDGVHNVKSPISARGGKQFDGPALITGTTTSGSRLITVKTGFSGRMTANKGGMKAVTLGSVVTLTPNPLGSAALKTVCTAGNDTAYVKVYPVTVPAGAITARFELRQSESGPGNDHDMMLIAPNGTTLYSGNDGSDEAVQIDAPAAGNYKVCVLAWGGAPSMTHRLSSWVVSAADASSTLNVMLPGNMTAGGTGTVGISWSGLAAGGRYLGGIQYKDPAGTVVGTTIVQVQPGAAAPLASAERTVSTKELAK
jgi:subtilisin family serine protease